MVQYVWINILKFFINESVDTRFSFINSITIMLSKHILPLLAAPFIGLKAYDPETFQGWQLSCSAFAGKLNEDGSIDDSVPGPYSLAYSGNTGSYGFIGSHRGRNYGSVIALDGTFGANKDNLCQNSKNTTTELIFNGIFDWPNTVSYVPDEVFGSGSKYILVTDGSPTIKGNDGCMAVVQLTSESYPVGANNMKFITPGCGYNLRPGKTRWFYTEAKWFDMDNDGDLDIIAPRASGLSGNYDVEESELDWWVNPGNPFDTETDTYWEHMYIPASRNIADMFFDIMTYGSDNMIYVVIAGFSSEELIVLYSNDWTRTSNINSQIVANDGLYSSVQFTDLNTDGIPDILATTGSANRNAPSLIAYAGYTSGNQNWLASTTKNTIYQGFPTFNSAGVSSPGQARAFHYNSNPSQTEGTIPSILISGHNDGYLYMADPISTDPSTFNWKYTTNIIFETDLFNPFVTTTTAPTVGVPVVLDLDNCGCNNVIVPGVATKQIHVLEPPSDRCP